MTCQFDYNAFMELLKRASHSGYKTFAMHNRMILNCYDLDSDSDIGVHYILHIPEEAPYDSEFFDITMELDTVTIMNAMKEPKKNHEIERKKQKIRPKDAPIIGYYSQKDFVATLSFDFMLGKEVWKTIDIELPQHDINKKDCPLYTNIERTYDMMINRIDSNSVPVVLDGIEEGIREKTLSQVRVYYHPVEIDGKEVPLPFLKSSFRAINRFDKFLVTIRKTNMKKIYLVTHTFQAKKLVDQYIMYVEDFR